MRVHIFSSTQWHLNRKAIYFDQFILWRRTVRKYCTFIDITFMFSRRTANNHEKTPMETTSSMHSLEIEVKVWEITLYLKETEQVLIHLHMY